MCGIAGFTRFKNNFGSVDDLKAMGQAIYHRGPDAGGEFLSDGVGLCHRRLSIIDLSAAGHQPMESANKQSVIAFNGEIYNFLELKQDLIQKGYNFKSETDTEVLLALYDEYGTKMLDFINGMFAFAIWDHKKESLFIARDRMGKKPLYYYVQDGDIYFASELKALLALNIVPKTLRLDAVHDFFAYQYIPDPKTIFENVFKLEPGHSLVINKNDMVINKYWDLSFSNQSDLNEDALKSQLNNFADKATAARMLSDVPLGAFLSGGVDSSGIVALMAKNSSTPVTTCSIGFDDKKFNETEFAKIVADQYQTDHHEFTVKDNVSDNLVNISKYFDEPFADPSLVPTYFVSKLAKEKVTVAIAGDGGDEIFAGYSKYSIDDIENKLRQKVPGWFRRSVFPALSSIAKSINLKPFKKAGSLLHSLSLEPAMGFYITNSMISDEHWNSLVKSEVSKKLGSYHPSTLTLEKYNEADGPDHLSKILYTDIKTYLPGGILVKVDRMSMANSLEVRAPLLDYELVEFAASVPSHLKFNNGEKKYLLKEAFKNSLPESILYRKKMGFSVPLATWLREDLKELCIKKLVKEPKGLVQVFKQEQINKYWTQHLKGSHDHSNMIWSMLIFQLWWDNYMEPTSSE